MIPMVSARNIRKSFGDTPVLRGVDLDVARGEILCLIGPSGSGKSTFLRCINHLECIDSGLLQVDGRFVGYEERNGRLYEVSERKLAARRAEIGMVFQRFNLFPHLTVLENVMKAPVLLGRLQKPQARQLAFELLDRVGLADKGDSYPAQLSGGQQQRVAIARALAMKPKLLLFDEPTSALDPELVGEVLSVIQSLAAEGRTMVVVTHEIVFAREVATKVALMDQGAIIEYGNPEAVIGDPQHPRAVAFFSNVR
jgi:polar amino acid transport system ATP-binding protein